MRLLSIAGVLAGLVAFVPGTALGHGGSTSKDPAKNRGAAYALIEGTVWDAANQPLYGARVQIRRAGEKKARWELTSDHRGEFAQRVAAGKADYVVSAEVPKAKGGKLVVPVEVTVHVESDERIDASLHLK